MTFNEARTYRNTYVVMSILALVLAVLILFVTFLKTLWLGFSCKTQFHQLCQAISSIKELIVSWLWPWMSESGFGGTSNPLRSPRLQRHSRFSLSESFLRKNAARLNNWLREVTELLAIEQMADFSRPRQSRQSIGDVQAGRDSHITQQITNYYNHRPDNPKAPIIAAVIGATAAIAAALLRKFLTHPSAGAGAEPRHLETAVSAARAFLATT